MAKAKVYKLEPNTSYSAGRPSVSFKTDGDGEYQTSDAWEQQVIESTWGVEGKDSSSRSSTRDKES